MTIWVIVASAARARIFETSGRGKPLEEIADLVNPEERLQRQDLGGHKPGRTFDSQGEGRHAMEAPTDPKDKNALDFAREVVETLEKALHDNRFDALCVIAAPRFLGQLREQMSDPLARLVKGEEAKDLTREATATIKDRIAHLL